MQVWHTKTTHPYIHPCIADILRDGDLFVDIETTGLSRAKHAVYLIGTAAPCGDGLFELRQFFAERTSEEKDVLAAFSELLKNGAYRRIITFNGARFDLPFLDARAKKHDVSFDLSECASFDIYKELTARKEFFQLPNYRQKTVEQFLGIAREDAYSGGELIRVYLDYEKQPTTHALDLLKLHNYEDVLGMIDLLSVFSYDALFTQPPCVRSAKICEYRELTGSTAQELLVTLTPPQPLVGALSSVHPVSGVYLRTGENGNVLRMRIPLYDSCVRIYYPDYKNYEYLPAEDMAIHKSLSACVDRSHKEKATPETCYTRVAVTDDFIHSDRLSQYIAHALADYACFSKKKDLFLT